MRSGVAAMRWLSSSYFESTEYSSKPPVSQFSLAARATTQTLPGGTSIA